MHRTRPGRTRSETHRGLAQNDRELARLIDATTIRQLLETLPGRSRMILYLRFFEHMSQAEIAEHVGTSQVHVGRLLKAGLEQLRRSDRPRRPLRNGLTPAQLLALM